MGIIEKDRDGRITLRTILGK